MNQCEQCKAELKPNERWYAPFCYACYQNITNDYYKDCVKCDCGQIHPPKSKCICQSASDESKIIKEVQELGRFLVDFDHDDDWEACAERLK